MGVWVISRSEGCLGVARGRGRISAARDFHVAPLSVYLSVFYCALVKEGLKLCMQVSTIRTAHSPTIYD